MSIKQVQDRLESIKINLDRLQKTSELYEAERIINEITDKIRVTKKQLEDFQTDQSSYSKPLLSSLRSYEKDLEIYENKLNFQQEKWDKKRREQDLIEGKLTGADALKAQREIGLENMKEVDNQGLIVDSIGENIKSANVNLTNINNELQNQGEQMNRIQEKTLETESQVKQTGKIMTKMEGRAKCIQIITCFAVVIFGLFDVVWIVFLLLRDK
jgi:hypothetical protein